MPIGEKYDILWNVEWANKLTESTKRVKRQVDEEDEDELDHSPQTYNDIRTILEGLELYRSFYYFFTGDW